MMFRSYMLTPGLLLAFFMHARYTGTRHFPNIKHFLQLILTHQTIFQNQLLLACAYPI